MAFAGNTTVLATQQRLSTGTCTESSDEPCFCCSKDYCNTEGFYNEKLGISNASIDPSSTISTSTSERPSESASFLHVPV